MAFILTFEDEKQLILDYRAGSRQAREYLVTVNQPAVWKIAKKLHRGAPHLPIEDLVSEGNIGLTRAIDGFDPDRNIRFLSYAAWWIRAYIRSFIVHNMSIVRMGKNTKERLVFSRIGTIKRLLQRTDPQMSVNKILEAVSEILNVPFETVLSVYGRCSKESSLDATVGDTDMRYGDTLVDEDALTPAEEVRQSQADEICHREIKTALALFDERERFIIEHRHLIVHTWTLQECGDHFGFSRERARQIETRALEKLRVRLIHSPALLELLAA